MGAVRMDQCLPLKLLLVLFLVSPEQSFAFLYSRWFQDDEDSSVSNGLMKPSEVHRKMMEKRKHVESFKNRPYLEHKAHKEFHEQFADNPVTFKEYQKYRDSMRQKRSKWWPGDSEKFNRAHADEITKKLQLEEWEELERLMREQEPLKELRTQENNLEEERMTAADKQEERKSVRDKRKQNEAWDEYREWRWTKEEEEEERKMPDERREYKEERQSGDMERYYKGTQAAGEEKTHKDRKVVRDQFNKDERKGQEDAWTYNERQVPEEDRVLPADIRSAEGKRTHWDKLPSKEVWTGQAGRYTHDRLRPEEKRDSHSGAEWNRGDLRYSSQQTQDRAETWASVLGKQLATLFPNNAIITIIVSFSWLLNILFIGWLVCRRESLNNMRIPSSFEYKPPVKAVRPRNTPVAEEHHPNGQADDSPLLTNDLEKWDSQKPEASSVPPPSTQMSPSLPVPNGRHRSSLKAEPLPPAASHVPAPVVSLDDTAWLPKTLAPSDVSSLAGRPYFFPRARPRDSLIKTSPKPLFSKLHPIYETSFIGRESDNSVFSDREALLRNHHIRGPADLSVGPNRLRSSFPDKDFFGSGDEEHRFINYNVSKHETVIASHADRIKPLLSERLKRTRRIKKDNDDREDDEADRRKKIKEAYESRKYESRNTNRDENVSSNKCLNGTINEESAERTEPKPPLASVSVEMYNLKDFVSLPDTILDALACSQSGVCQHDHNKYRMVGDKLYILSGCSDQRVSKVGFASHSTVPEKPALEERQTAGVDRPKSDNKETINKDLCSSESTNQIKSNDISSKTNGENNERKTNLTYNKALSPIPQDVSTQISPDAFNYLKQMVLTPPAATASITTQCPSTSMVARCTQQQESRTTQSGKISTRKSILHRKVSTVSVINPSTSDKFLAEKQSHLDLKLKDKRKAGPQNKEQQINKVAPCQKSNSEKSDTSTAEVKKAKFCPSVSHVDSGHQVCNKQTSTQRIKSQYLIKSQEKKTVPPETAEAKGGDLKTDARTLHIKECTIVAPPPFGYHVRKDYSSSESNLDSLDKMQNDKAKQGIDDKSGRHEVADGKGKCSTEVCTEKLGESREKTAEKPAGACRSRQLYHEGSSDGKLAKDSTKKLMIIGKLNYFNVSRETKDDKDKKAQALLHFGLACGDQCVAKEKPNRTTPKTIYRLLKRRKTPLNENEEVPTVDKKSCIKAYISSLCPSEDPRLVPKYQESVLYCRSPVTHSEKLVKRCQPRKNVSRRSARFRRSMRNAGHNVLAWRLLKKDKKKRAPVYARILKSVKSNFNPRHAKKRHYLPRGYDPHKGHTSGNGNLLPSYFLNVNTNAGIVDGYDDPKADAKRTSSTSVHSNDQFYSTHTDTPDGKNIDSDVEVSPSFSFTEEVDKLIANAQQQHDPDLSTRKGMDQERHVSEGWEEKKQNIMQACNEAIKNRLQRRNLEEIITEEGADFGEKQAVRSGLESQPLAANKHKKKTKTTEAVYIKFESSMSKKVTTTTVVKDGRKIPPGKPRICSQKQLSNGEAPKAIGGPSEKTERKAVVDTPRHTKIIRCTDGLSETSDARPRQKQFSDTNIEALKTREQPRQTRTAEKQAIRSTESDHRSNIPQDSMNCKSDDVSFVKQIICWPSKDMPPLESPEYQRSPRSPRSHNDTRTDLTDSDKVSEKASSVITVVHLLPSQTSLQRDTAQRDLSATRDAIHAMNDKRSDKSESPGSPKYSSADGTLRRKTKTRSKCDSSSRKSSPESVPKQNVKMKKSSVKTKNKSTDDLVKDAGSEESGEVTKVKALQKQMSALRRRSPMRKKLHSRSPDMKKKRRCAKRKELHADKSDDVNNEDPKVEKHKKGKNGEKSGEKKKKKKKMSCHSDEEEYLDESKLEKKSSRSRSRSSETQKATQTVSCSAFSPRFVDALLVHSEKQKIGSLVWKNQLKEYEDKPAPKEKANIEEPIRSLDRESVSKNRDQRCKNLVASVENVSISSATGVQIRSAESIPTFTGTVYKTPTKLVQVPSCPPGKKSEKDLQQAELGWNSSMLSEATKAAAEKAKQSQRRNKMRYYIVKPKPKQADKEVGASKLKRPTLQISHTDGDGASSSGDIDFKGDALPREKNGNGQGKSVQFSDSIEELEASKTDIQCESSASPERHDNEGSSQDMSTPVLEDISAEVPPASIRPPAKPELLIQKVEQAKKEVEQRAHNTPPKRKKPVWLKKPSNTHAQYDPKDKSKQTSKSSTAIKNTLVPAKNAIVATNLPMKMRHSTENVVRPGSRFNFHVYYPVKPTCGSPKTSNISLNEKRAVAYNTWINSIFLAAPLNKATKKLVAKIGSPVDIKEIIEGSSVDAADHFRVMRSLQEASLRTAKSVPALGPPRPATANVSGGKQAKSQKAVKNLLTKKLKEAKPHESASCRSLSSIGASEDSLGSSTQLGPLSRNVPMGSTFAMSTDIDEVAGLKHKMGHNRHLSLSRRKEKKHGKRSIQPLQESVDWQLVAAQDAGSSPALSRNHYYGDMELDVLNMGIAWMVQNFFNRLSFLNPRHQTSNANASGDMQANQQIID